MGVKALSGNDRIVLVSASPRRRELIERLGLSVALSAADVDERQLAGEGAVEMARRLALAKARELRVDGVVVAADTVVVSPDGAEILGKPVDAADARRMLRCLRGVSHTVVTGVAVRGGPLELIDQVVTAVLMRAYTDAEIDGYIASGSPLDKAGAYGIQDGGFSPVASIDGCYLNVVGLPLCAVARLLRQLGLALPNSAYARADCDCSREPRLHQAGDLHPAG